MWLRWCGIVCLSILNGCSGEPSSGPVEVRWDRHACERCRMVLSDPHFASQVRYKPAGVKRSRVVLFDDIGCAVLWLEERPRSADEHTEIWVADHRNGAWIDARSATYVRKKISPMEYGLGAQPEEVEGGLDFTQAKQHISRVEQQFNLHGQQLERRLREQAEQRRLMQGLTE